MIQRKKKQLVKIKKRIKFLDEARLYLETNPRESFVIEQQNDLVLKISRMLDETYKNLMPKSKIKYKRESGAKQLEQQLDLLKFILSKY